MNRNELFCVHPYSILDSFLDTLSCDHPCDTTQSSFSTAQPLVSIQMPFTATTLRQFFVTHLPTITQQCPVPEALKTPHQALDHAASTGTLTPWWLAERILLHALKDATLENEVVELMTSVQRAVAAEDWWSHAFDIVDQVMDVMTYAFQNVTLMNAFDADNALATVYYMLVFVVCCAGGEGGEDTSTSEAESTDTSPSSITTLLHTYSPALMRIASVVHKLLMNQEVFTFVRNGCGTFEKGCERDEDGACSGWRCVPRGRSSVPFLS